MRIYTDSLSRTIDTVNDACFFERPVSAGEREEVALWIAGRRGMPGAYAEMFAPTPSEQKAGILLFTGELVGPSAALRHISGEEACRALILLRPRSTVARAALKQATAGMLAALKRAEEAKRAFFCCGTCDPSLWRHISAGGLRGAEDWLQRGMKVLRAHRDGSGKWRRFPFFFTLLALAEIDLPAARREMEYAAPVCERYLSRMKPSNQYMVRKRAVAERVLANC